MMERSVADIEQHERRLARQLLEGLEATDGVRVQGPTSISDRLGVVSLHVDQYEPGELATMLEAIAGVQGRPGIHCAPQIHQALGTSPRGGTMRLSVGAFTSNSEIAAAVDGIRQIATIPLDL